MKEDLSHSDCCTKPRPDQAVKVGDVSQLNILLADVHPEAEEACGIGGCLAKSEFEFDTFWELVQGTLVVAMFTEVPLRYAGLRR